MKVKEETKSLIKECKDFCSSIQSTCDMILDGNSITEACKSNDIDTRQFMNIVKKGYRYNNNYIDDVSLSNYLVTSKERLLMDIFGVVIEK